MNCPDQNELSTFVEGGLPDLARGEIQRHIDTCPECFQLIVELAKMNAPVISKQSEIMGSDETLASVDGMLDTPRSGSMSGFGAGTMVGRMLDGRYLIGQIIGRGGFAEVYRATQLSVGRDVAIKVLSADLSTKPELVARFQAEAKIISRLKHPNILKLFDFGTTKDDRLYIVVELLEGKPVDHLLGVAPIEQQRLAQWLKQICAALQEAHAAGIYHRDLKPSNLFLETIGNQDFVKILDFGIAKIEDTKQTASGVIMGTPSYMSPEQIEALSIDHRTDLYSLGVIAFEALTGQPPFTGDTPVMVMYKHAKQTAPRVEDIATDIHPALATLVSKLLEKKPENRPAHAAEVVRYLDEIDWHSQSIPSIETSFDGPSVPGSTATDDSDPLEKHAPGQSELTKEDSPPLILGGADPRFSPIQAEDTVSHDSDDLLQPPVSRRRALAIVAILSLAAIAAYLWVFPPLNEASEVINERSSARVTSVLPPDSKPLMPTLEKTVGIVSKAVSRPDAAKPPGTQTALKSTVKVPLPKKVPKEPISTGSASTDSIDTLSKKKIAANLSDLGSKARRKQRGKANSRSKRLHRNRTRSSKDQTRRTGKLSARPKGKVRPLKKVVGELPARVDIRLTPLSPTYEIGQTALIRAVVRDKNGDTLRKQPPVVWKMAPQSAAEIQKGRLRFKVLGKIKITGCVVGTTVCKSIFRAVTTD